MPDSFDPRAALIFDGVGDDEVIGDFGIVQAAPPGAEVDRYDLALGSPPDALRGRHLDAATPTTTSTVARRSPMTPPGLGGTRTRTCAPTWSTSRRRAAARVFSAGSIAWLGSLSHNDYDNNVARITGNVLRRFARREPLDW